MTTAHDHDADEVDEEYGQCPCVRQFDDVHEGNEPSDDGDEDGADERRQIRRLVRSVNFADAMGQ